MDLYHIVGHEGVVERIVHSIDAGTLSHAHLIVGEDGIGKSLLARCFAARILGKKEYKELVDIFEWRTAANKQSIGVNEIRDKVIAEINMKPYEGDKKVIIIYGADKMTIEAQNAFLKTVEEPPKGIFILMICENLELILDTIKSRCHIHKLRPLTPDHMRLFLRRKYNALSSQEMEAAISFSDGIPGRAEAFLEDASFKEIRDTLIDMMIKLKTKTTSELLRYGDFYVKYKDRWKDVLTCLLSYIRDVMIFKETVNEDLILNTDKIYSIRDLSSIFSFSQLNDMIEIISRTRDNLESNVNYALVFDNMILKMQAV